MSQLDLFGDITPEPRIFPRTVERKYHPRIACDVDSTDPMMSRPWSMRLGAERNVWTIATNTKIFVALPLDFGYSAIEQMAGEAWGRRIFNIEKWWNESAAAFAGVSIPASDLLDLANGDTISVPTPEKIARIENFQAHFIEDVLRAMGWSSTRNFEIWAHIVSRRLVDNGRGVDGELLLLRDDKTDARALVCCKSPNEQRKESHK